MSPTLLMFAPGIPSPHVEAIEIQMSDKAYTVVTTMF